MALKTNSKDLIKLLLPFFITFSVSCQDQTRPTSQSDNTEKEINSNTNSNSSVSEPTTPDINEPNTSTIEDIASYITEHNFDVNGNGSISFTNGTITIKGSDFTLRGDYTITGSKSLRISNLVATDGDYDPSNNNGSFGTIILNSDGTLSQTLSDGTSVRNYTLTPQ